MKSVTLFEVFFSARPRGRAVIGDSAGMIPEPAALESCDS